MGSPLLLALLLYDADAILFDCPSLASVPIPIKHPRIGRGLFCQGLKLQDNTGVVGADGRHLSIVEPVNICFVHFIAPLKSAHGKAYSSPDFG